MPAHPARELRQGPSAKVRPTAVLLAATGGLIFFQAAACSGPAGRLAVQTSPCSRAFVFVDHGRPAARIEIPEGAGEAVRQAADILQTSLFRMSGVDLPVIAVKTPHNPGVAAVGFPEKDLPPTVASSLPSLRPEGYLVATSAGNLFITGGEGRGVVRGVVHLLEKYYGCRLDSSAAGRFPRRDDLALGCLFEVDNPSTTATPARPRGTGPRAPVHSPVGPRDPSGVPSWQIYRLHRP